MSPKVFEPRRLREGSEQPRSVGRSGGKTVEDRLARHLSILSVHAPMPRLRRHSAPSGRRRYLAAIIRGTAVAILIVAVSGMAAAAATYVARVVLPRLVAVGPDKPVEAARKQGSRGTRKVGARSEAEPAQAGPGQPEANVEPAPANLARPEKRPAPKPGSPTVKLAYNRPTERRRSPEEPGGQAVSHARTDGVIQEASLLSQALSALRRDHDARRTLALLDDYDRRFGQGALAPEAASARAQALLQLGEYARARKLLEELPLVEGAYPVELRVTRGELRSLSGRCRQALLDFDAVLQASPDDASDEVARALFGRASCRARMGDTVGAQEDRQRYLKEFPEGPAARQLLSAP